MCTVSRSVDVAVPFTTAVNRWSIHARSSEFFPEAVPSFQRLAEKGTRVTLSVAHRRAAYSDVVALLLENELEQFKNAVEASESTLDGFVRRLRGLLP